MSQYFVFVAASTVCYVSFLHTAVCVSSYETSEFVRKKFLDFSPPHFIFIGFLDFDLGISIS